MGDFVAFMKKRDRDGLLSWFLELICARKTRQYKSKRSFRHSSVWPSSSWWTRSVFPAHLLQTQRRGPPLEPRCQTPHDAPPTQESRVGSVAWAMGLGLPGTTSGPSFPSSSLALWWWPSSTCYRPSSMGGPSKTHSSLSSSMSAGPGLLQSDRTLHPLPRCLVASPHPSSSTTFLTCTGTRGPSELFACRMDGCPLWLFLFPVDIRHSGTPSLSAIKRI